MPKEVGLATYCTKIRPLLEYAAPVWAGIPLYLMNGLERVQRRSLRIIGLPVDTLTSLCEKIEKLTLREMEAIIRDTNHPCHQLVPVAHSHGYSTRTKGNNSNVDYIKSRTERHKSSFVPRAVQLKISDKL